MAIIISENFHCVLDFYSASRNVQKYWQIWTGEGDNGKSITQDIFEKMLGPICNKPTPLKEMEKYGRRLKDDMIEIEVPDTYDLFLIVLAFMYTGNIVKPDNLKSIGSNSNTKKPMKDINTAKNDKRTVYDPIEVFAGIGFILEPVSDRGLVNWEYMRHSFVA